MMFPPFYDFGTGCAAYVFGCGSLGRCAVVDPRDGENETYAVFERSKGMHITHVIDTQFIDALSDVPPKPVAMEEILRINQGKAG